jgi:hypothetical protein
VTVAVVDEAGEEVRRLADDRPLGRGRHRFIWDGRTAAGRPAPDGPYRLQVVLRRQGRAVTAPRTLVLDTRPPQPRIVRVSPSTLAPGGGRRARIRYAGPSDPGPLVRVYRSRGRRAREVEAFRGPRFRRTAEWDGRVGGRPAPPGLYALSVTVRDPAGNAASAPAELPPRPATAAPRTGVTVRRLAVAGPLTPVAAGRTAKFATGSRGALSFTLRRLGAGRTLARGRARGPAFAVRVPARARPGLLLLRVRGGGARAAAPLVVGGGAPRGLPLVILPAATWQGLNPVDEDRDGFADTLPRAASVLVARPWAGGALPPGLRAEAGPLLRFLDRDRRPYELTTDVALARGAGPPLRGRRGALVAGSARWVPARTARGLRAWVERGGRVVLVGADAFRREVGVTPLRLRGPTPPRAVNALGERTRLVAGDPIGMQVVRRGRLRLFAGTDSLGPFRRVEESRGLPRGGRLLAAAGRRGRPAFVAYSLGRGIVVRTGTRAWAGALGRDPAVRGVTRRTWALLRE